MNHKLINNIFNSGIEKIILLSSQFVITMILIRTLGRESYGIIGIVTGYYAILSILNLSIEPIILRDHKKYTDINKVIFNFEVFNIFKIVILLIFSLILSYFLSKNFTNINFLYSMGSIFIITSLEILISPFVFYASSQYRQQLVTKITFIRVVLNLILAMGLFYIPTLEYIFYKDIVIFIIILYLWINIAYKELNIKFTTKLFSQIDINFIWKTIVNYSLWSHLTSISTNIIYKIDTVFLSFFVGLNEIGDYNIALNSANVANILPGILGYQNKVALSHTKTEEEAYKISNMFIRLSIYIGLFTFIIFYFFGDFYLYLITGNDNNENIYIYMMFIVTGLIILKSFASGFTSFIAIKNNIKSLFIYITLPSLISALILYYISASQFGVYGIAFSNLLISLIWLVLFIVYLKKINYVFKEILSFKKDIYLIKKKLYEIFF